MKADDFLKKLLSTFKGEAEDHLRNISGGLLELEKPQSPDRQMQFIEFIFREVHSFKGAARAVNNADIESVCQALETTFAALKRGEIVVSPVLLDTLNDSRNLLSSISASVESGTADRDKSEILHLIEKLRNATAMASAPFLAGPSNASGMETRQGQFRSDPSPAVFPGVPTDLTDMVRIRASKLQALVLQAEELIPLKLGLAERSMELTSLKRSLQNWKKELAQFSISGSQQPNLEWMDWNHAFFKSFEKGLNASAKSLDQDHRALGRMSDNLLQEAKKAMMLPFSTLLEAFPQIVRDLARGQGKEVDLFIEGAEMEIDRRILQEFKHPLLHLVRNCIDHGIEQPEERKRKQKRPGGKITIVLSRKDGDKIEIQITDDGAGIDVEKVKFAAVKLGMISQDEAVELNTQEMLSLVFRSGLTTSTRITDISGRGLGLAILLEKVEKLGGGVSVETNPHTGTSFRILLPSTLATFRGVLVRVKEEVFVIPTINIDRVIRITPEDISTVENKETISLNGRIIPIVRLSDVLEFPRSREVESQKRPAVILGSGDRRLAFIVDDVLNEQEILAKTLGSQLARVRNIAGGAILGTGKTVTILNVPDLMKSALQIHASPVQVAVPEKRTERKSVLVAEDSITARTLIKNILESAGYSVKTAVDGIDAFTALREGNFDLVVSDIDMPRMGGLDLTAKIRADKKLSELPVVLVTALDTREDRERGIDVGANAYIVKSSFDQSNLLEAIRRLL